MGLLSKRCTMMSQTFKLYRTDGPFARLKRALVAASEEKWDTIPDIKDYDNPRRYAHRDYPYLPNWYAHRDYLYLPNCKRDFAVAFDDIENCISELKAIDPWAFIADYIFLDEVNAITQINPKNPIGWIAAVMILEFAGNIKKARELIQQGCEELPNNELVWLEACRLESPVEAKAVIARALKAIPKSEKLWMQAAELELGNVNKSKVLMEGLEKIPDSFNMLNAVVEVANEEDARLLLQRGALKAIPKSEKLWMCAAKLELGDANKSKVLLQGLKEIPNSVKMWKAVVELADEEQARLLLQRAVQLCYGSAIQSAIAKLKKVAGEIDKAGEIIELAIRSVHMQKGMKKVDTHVWIDETEFVQQAAFVPIYQAIIPTTIASWECHLIKMAFKGNDQRASRLEPESKKDSKRKVHSMSNEDWNRGNDRRAARLEQESKKDLKRKLHSMSNEDWDSIPQDGDYPSWNKKRVKYFEPVPGTVQMHDTVSDLTTVGEAESGKLASTSTAVDPEVYLAKDWNSYPEVEDYLSLNKKRVKKLASTLDAIPISGLTAVDPEVYLVDLNLMDEIRSDLQINPNYSGSWIAAARRAESAWKIHEARQLIQEGCQMCPKKEDVWLEACRLANTDKAKYVIARGLEMIPKSEKLWMQAAKQEHDNVKKSMVLAKGLENIPGSTSLKNAVEELANEEDANIGC